MDEGEPLVDGLVLSPCCLVHEVNGAKQPKAGGVLRQRPLQKPGASFYTRMRLSLRVIIENKHSNDFKSPPPAPCICMNFHSEGKSYSPLRNP